MVRRPVAVALEPGAPSYAALRVAADIAVRLRCPLRAYALCEGVAPTLRALRRVKLAGRRRGLETSFVSLEGTLLDVSRASVDARLLVVGRARTPGAPGLKRRLLLGSLLRASGPPLLVVPGRVRPLGERVLLASSGDGSTALDEFYDAVKPLVVRVSILRFLTRAGLPPDRLLDDAIAAATSWDERIIHADEGHDEGDAILAAAARLHPTLVAIGRAAQGPGFAALIAPEAADRVLQQVPHPVLVARPAAAPLSLAAA
jgi:nucleotide-binding universal stress UspA family protein